MEKENPVIKNYILSAERRVIYNDAPSKIKSILHQSCGFKSKPNAFTPENSLCRELLEQNKVSFYLFP